MHFTRRRDAVRVPAGGGIQLAVSAAVLAMGMGGVMPRTAIGVAWNGTDPSYSAPISGGLTDNYGQFTNESVIYNTDISARGTCTYLANGWFLTAQHVGEGTGGYGTYASPGQMEINVYGTYYYGDSFSTFGSADVLLVHVGGSTSGTLTSLTGVEKRQVAGAGDGLCQVGGFGYWGQLGATQSNATSFHRAFNTPSVSGAFLDISANANSRLVTDGYLMGIDNSGDSGSGMWEDNGPSDQDLDLNDWSLTGVCQTGNGSSFGSSGAYGFLQDYSSQIWSTVYPHAVLTWNANPAAGTTAVDGSGTWNLTSTNFTDGTNFAFNGPERTEQAIFGTGNGSAGTVTLGATIPLDELIFNAAGSGTYTIAGPSSYSLDFRAGGIILTNVNATISANITGGSSSQEGAVWEVSKEGSGTLTLTGKTTLDSGVTFHARGGTTIIANGASFIAPWYASIAVYSGETATLSLQGTGSFTSGGDFNLGDLGGSGTLNLQDTASLNAVNMYIGKGIGGNTGAGGTGVINQTGGTVTVPTISMATNHPLSVGIYNLNGGTLKTSSITGGLGTSTFNFNGGQLVASASSTTFIQTLTSATINGSAVINTNGYSVTLAQPLLHSSSAPAIDGGLIKNGAGTLTLGGLSSYTGPTRINAGTITLNPAAGAAAVAIQPVGSYSFDNVSGSTVINGGSGGTAMNATLSGNATIVSGGKFGNAVSLSNGGSVVVNSPITDTGSAANYTISAWVHTTTPGATIIDKSDGGWTWDDTIFYLGDGNAGGSGGVPSSVRYGRGFFQAASNTPSVDDGNWHMVTYVDAAGNYSMYTDGTQVSLSSGNAGFTPAVQQGGTVTFGTTTDTYSGDGTVNFNGLLDEIQIYNRALSPSQIQRLYTADSPNPVAANSVLPATTPLTLAAGAVLNVNGIRQTIASLNGAAGSFVTLGSGQLTITTTGTATCLGLISGTGSIAMTGSGTQILGGDDTYTGTTTVTGGTLNLGANQNTAGIFVRNSSGVTITNGKLIAGSAASNANRDLIVIAGTGLTLSGNTNAWTGTLDLGSNDLDIVNAGASGLITMTNQIRSGYVNGAWNGPGIDSSAAAGATSHLFALGTILNNNTYGTASGSLGNFDTIYPGANDVLIKYTYFGDANLDGKVDGSDYSRIDNGFSTGLTGWFNGDFNYDGVVDGSDYTLIDNAFNTQGAAMSGEVGGALVASTAQIAETSSVPEPSVFGMIGGVMAGVFGLGRSARFRKMRLATSRSAEFLANANELGPERCL